MLLISNQSNTSHLSDFESTVITPWIVLQYFNWHYIIGGGMVASWLVHSTPDRAAQVWGDIALFMGKTLHSHSASFHPGV